MHFPFQIVYEDNHLLVVNKPAMLPTMGVESGQPSLVSEAKAYLKRKYNKPGNVFLGVVSRLDSFVSGVVVLAKTSKAASRLSEQFRNRETVKTYWAIVADYLDSESGMLTDWLAKDEPNHRMMTVSNPDEIGSAKLAKLEYQTLGVNDGKRLIQIDLLTGRKHQIRIQFSSRRSSVVGDRKYGSRLPFFKGIALHSRTLRLTHPTQKEVHTFESLPPEAWNLGLYGIERK